MSDDTVDMGKCHVCGKIMPFEGNFQRTGVNKGWGTPWGGKPRFYKNICRRCYADQKKKERDNDKEKFLAQENKRYHKNKKILQERNKQYRKDNREELLRKSRERRKNNLEYYRTYQREYCREWYKKNTIKALASRQLRRARKKSATILGIITKEQIEALYERQKGKCPVCKKKLNGKFHVDHIIPLSKLGTHEILNLQLLHPRCNLIKGGKDPIEFMQFLGFLI